MRATSEVWEVQTDIKYISHHLLSYKATPIIPTCYFNPCITRYYNSFKLAILVCLCGYMLAIKNGYGRLNMKFMLHGIIK